MVQDLNPRPTKYYDRVNCNIQNIAWIPKISKNSNYHMECVHDIHMDVSQTTNNGHANEQWTDRQTMARPMNDG